VWDDLNLKWAFKQHAKGSIKAASSLVILSGIGTIPLIMILFKGILMYSAKPPLTLEPIS
jgi:hypothetical protein